MEVTARASLIDLFFLILFLRVAYISVAKGLLVEAFKIAGLLVSSFFAFHYYPYFADKVVGKIPLLSKEYLQFVSFCSIFLATGVIFIFLRLIAIFLVRREDVPLIERRLAFFAGIFRAAFLSSMIFFILYLFPFKLQPQNPGISYRMLKNFGPKAYLIALDFYNKKINKNVILNKEVEKYYEAEKHL